MPISGEPVKPALPKPHPLRRYGMAIAMVLAATLLRHFFLPGLGMRVAFITFYPAIMLAALYGGLRAGVLATVLSAAVADYFWMEPAGSFIMSNQADWAALAIFVASGGLMSWLAERVHQSSARKLEAEVFQRVELERLVGEGTIELTNEIAERAREQVAAEHLAAIVTSSSEAILSKALDGRITSWNPAAARLFGYGAEEIIGQPISRLIPPERIVEETEILARLGRGERIERYETSRMAKDGRKLDVSLTISPLKDAAGNVIGASKIIHDITERRRAEQAERESQERMNAVMENLTEGIMFAEAGGLVVYWNAVALAMFGYASMKECRRKLADFGDTFEFRDLDDNSVLPVADWPMSRAMRGEVQRDREVRVRRLDQDWEKILACSGWLIRGAHGETLAFISASDITERKRAEEALRKSEQRLKRVFESPLLGLVYWNMNGDIVDANDKFLDLVGYERADLAAGRISWKQMTPPEFAHLGSLAELKATAANSVPFEKEYIRKDGSRVPVLAARAMFDEAHGDGVAFIIDISERKQAERALALAKAEAERANIAKSKFLAAASHDLRQPVQSLTLLLSLIKGQVKDKPKTADAVEMAKSAVNSLNGLLTGILDISKLDAGVVAPDIASVNLGETIDRLAKEYASRAAAEGLTLRHVSSALWARTDESLMDRIARNLIENALRYTKKGGILIGLRRRGDNVRFDVIDTGIGIPADKKKEIFEEFRQLDNPARDASRGLGLGLAIVSRLANLLGAPVEVASNLGQGTRFSLLLPLDRTEAPAAREAPAPEVAGGRILVIEDDGLIRQAYEMMLESWGYETLSAANGEEALECAAQANWRFDAIIADHRLGSGMSGNAAATEIARRAGRSFPTVLVTGDTAKERLAEISASGFIMLHKPVEADDLLRTVQSLLGAMAGFVGRRLEMKRGQSRGL